MITVTSYRQLGLFKRVGLKANRTMMTRTILACAAVLTAISCTAGTPPLQPVAEGKGKVLILGDSQISFGAGAPYAAFFANLGSNCPDIPDTFQQAKASAIGVRSTALHHWTSKSNRAPICDIDKKYGVNAGAYGVTSAKRTYVQIGQNRNYPFCPKNRSSLQAVFDAPAHDPDLIVLSFLGNAVDRWQSPETAREDWAATARQLPPEVACIAMTTIPSYDAKINAKRQIGQANLARAVNESGRCAFVPGFTPRTIAAFEGNAKHFRTNASGRVIDPGHPSEASAGKFVKLQTPALCAALTRVLPD